MEILPIIAGLAVGAGLIVAFALFTNYSNPASEKPLLSKTTGNVFGIDARVAYADANSAILCPLSPCDTSGFVLKIVGSNIQDVVVLGYDICSQSSNGVPLSCVHAEENKGFSSLIHISKTESNQIDDAKHNLPELEGAVILLDRKLTVNQWEMGDNVRIIIKATPAITLEKNGTVVWQPDEKSITWSDLGVSKIERYPIL